MCRKQRTTGQPKATPRDSTTTHYFLPSPLCRDWCFLCLPRKPSGRPSFLLPFARLWIIFLDPFCQLRNLFQCASIEAASVFREHWAQALSMMLFAVASCFKLSAASATCLFLARARITFRAFTTWVHLVNAFLISGSPSSTASHVMSDALSSLQTTGRGAWPRGAWRSFGGLRVDGASPSVMSLDIVLQRAAVAAQCLGAVCP